MYNTYLISLFYFYLKSFEFIYLEIVETIDYTDSKTLWRVKDGLTIRNSLTILLPDRSNTFDVCIKFLKIKSYNNFIW